jgi:hypothetical protein
MEAESGQRECCVHLCCEAPRRFGNCRARGGAVVDQLCRQRRLRRVSEDEGSGPDRSYTTVLPVADSAEGDVASRKLFGERLMNATATDAFGKLACRSIVCSMCAQVERGNAMR